jgi:hypothetical protein
MKNLRLTTLALIFSVAIFSCSKTNNAPTYSIVGTWTGSLTGVNEANFGLLYYSFIIKSDSTIATQSTGTDGKTYLGNGTWKLNGTNFSAKSVSNGTAQTITAIFSSSRGSLTSGAWSNDNGTDSGTFTMTRVN